MKGKDFTITRDSNGIPHVLGDSMTGMFRGQGYVHAMDRGMQLLLMRILGRGQLSEYLDASDESLAIDIFFMFSVKRSRSAWQGMQSRGGKCSNSQ